MTYKKWLLDNKERCIFWGLHGHEILGFLRDMAAGGDQDSEDILLEPVDDSTGLGLTIQFINMTIITCGAAAVAQGKLTKHSSPAEVEAEFEFIRNIFRQPNNETT